MGLEHHLTLKTLKDKTGLQSHDSCNKGERIKGWAGLMPQLQLLLQTERGAGSLSALCR